MTVLDIRGTHGSGKSWIMHWLLKEYDHVDIVDDTGHIGYHLIEFDAALLGKYKTDCGGCDSIKTADEVVHRVRLFAKQYRHVLLEGILVSHTFKRYSDLANELSEYGYVFFFLNTSLKKCIARVQSRRFRKGNVKPFNPTHLTHDWRQIWRNVRKKCTAAGHDVVVLDRRNPLPRIVGVLKNAVG
ncbi:hypothetical protein LCGC14_0428920 [marine sediment metagenome]|uniref:Zeta toxin domain-containing protein n=1 Tax=marine sediment metagenome TaxID=412755 RepID=A0A0F9SUP7_9ZZZZ